MNSISAPFKNLLSGSFRLLNQPVVKEGVKHLAGTVTFAFGLVEIYDLFQYNNKQTYLTPRESAWAIYPTPCIAQNLNRITLMRISNIWYHF